MAGSRLIAGRPANPGTIGVPEVRDGQESENPQEAEAAEDRQEEVARGVRGNWTGPLHRRASAGLPEPFPIHGPTSGTAIDREPSHDAPPSRLPLKNAYVPAVRTTLKTFPHGPIWPRSSARCSSEHPSRSNPPMAV